MIEFLASIILTVGFCTGHIGLAKIKRGRFVSLEASFDGGMVLTKPLILRSSQLSVDANAEFGSIKIALLDEQERQIPGWQNTIYGEDSIRIPVNCQQGSLGDLAERSIRIQFILKNAQIFGFCVK